FTVVDLGARELEARRLDSGRSVFDQEHRQPVAGNLAHFGQHQAIAVGVDKRGIDPPGAGVGQLANVQLARRRQYLAILAVDRVPVDVAVVEDVVRAKRLDLGNGVVKSAPIPQADIIQQVFVTGDIDRSAGLCLEVDFVDTLFESEGGTGSMDVRVDVRPLERDLIGPYVQGRHRSWHDELHRQCEYHQARQGPAAQPDEYGGSEAGSDQQPLQRQSDIEVDVVDADKKRAVVVIDHFEPSQPETKSQRQQQHDRSAAKEARLQASFEAEDSRIDFLQFP